MRNFNIITKVFVVACLLAIITALGIVGISAETYSGTCGAEGDGSNLTWTLDTETGVLNIEGTGAMANWSPSSFQSSPWFSNRINIKSVVIGNGVTSIGECAFRTYTSLVSVEISNSVTDIGTSAFSACIRMTSVVIGDNVTSIGKNAFFGCSSLTSIDIPRRVMSIGQNAFVNCSSLTDIIIYSKTSEIYDSSETIPDTATIHGCADSAAQAYAEKYDRTFVTINTISGICGAKGDGSNLIWTLDLDTEVLSIEGTGAMANWEFYLDVPWYANLSNIKNVVIENGVTSIGNYAFFGCSKLVSIELPDGMTRIGSYAFGDCSSLISIEIPDSVRSIGKASFSDCISLESMIIPFVGATKGGGEYTYFGYIFGADSADLNADHVPVRLKKVVITGGTSIDKHAFFGCIYLTSIEVPNSVTSIGRFAFGQCANLTSIEIPDSVTYIDYGAFLGCRMTSITIPFVGATKDGAEYTHFGYIFGADSADLNADYVPVRLKNVVISGGTSIGKYAFLECNNLTSIEIPDSVTSIGDGAFADCSSLTSIEIPSEVTSIGDMAFFGCSSLTSIEVPDSVTSIGDATFYGCGEVTRIKVDEKNTVYHSDNNCLIKTTDKILMVGCQNSIIPNDGSVTSIGFGAFSGRIGLTSIAIPSNIISVDKYAFVGCSGLTSIEISSSVTSIGNAAFRSCSGLTDIIIWSRDVTIYDSLNTIDDITTIHGYADSTAQAYAETYDRTFVIIPEILDNITVLEADVTYSADVNGEGVEALVSYTKGDAELDILYADKATGALKFKNASGEYESLYSKDGTAIILNADAATQIAVIYDDIRGTVRYYVGEQVPYYGAEESRALANDIAVNADFVNAEGSEKIDVLDGALSNVKAYNIHDSGTAEILAFQDHTEQSHIRILSGVDMPWYMSIGYELEVYVDGIGQGKNTIETDVIFSSVVANGVDVYASQYGYNYFSVFEIDYVDVSDNREYYIIINPFTRVGAAKYDGTPAKIDIDVNGTYSFDENY